MYLQRGMQSKELRKIIANETKKAVNHSVAQFAIWHFLAGVGFIILILLASLIWG